MDMPWPPFEDADGQIATGDRYGTLTVWIALNMDHVTAYRRRQRPVSIQASSRRSGNIQIHTIPSTT